MNSIQWRSENSLLRTLSDERLLSLGPKPVKAGDYPSETVLRKKTAKGEGQPSDKVSNDLLKVGTNLSKVGGDLSKVGGDLSKVGGDLANKKARLSERWRRLSKLKVIG